MSSKLEKILSRKKKLIDLANESLVWCSKHRKYLKPYEIVDKLCYNGSNGKKYCQYLYIPNERQ